MQRSAEFGASVLRHEQQLREAARRAVAAEELAARLQVEVSRTKWNCRHGGLQDVLRGPVGRRAAGGGVLNQPSYLVGFTAHSVHQHLS